MPQSRRACALWAALVASTATTAGATPATFTMHGWLAPGTSLAGAAITVDTPFDVTASFDTSSTNLVGHLPFPGFVAYTPSSVTLTVAGVGYALQAYDPSTHLGFSVAIFDESTPFSPSHYAAGLIQDPVADGAGIVGDWLDASTPFVSTGLQTTTFSTADFFGVGFGSGVCLSACRTPGEIDAVTPIPLTVGGVASSLVLRSLNETYYTHATDPGATPGPLTKNAWSASIATPEPSSWALMLIGFGAVGAAVRRRAVKGGLPA